MASKNAFYAQSGGVTAVINASACGMLQTARQHSDQIGKVYAGRNGIIGALTEDLIDTSIETEVAIASLKHTPGGDTKETNESVRHMKPNKAPLVEIWANWSTDQRLALTWEKQPDAPS